MSYLREVHGVTVSTKYADTSTLAGKVCSSLLLAAYLAVMSVFMGFLWLLVPMGVAVEDSFQDGPAATNNKATNNKAIAKKTLFISSVALIFFGLLATGIAGNLANNFIDLLGGGDWNIDYFAFNIASSISVVGPSLVFLAFAFLTGLIERNKYVAMDSAVDQDSPGGSSRRPVLFARHNDIPEMEPLLSAGEQQEYASCQLNVPEQRDDEQAAPVGLYRHIR
jgi:hypothetical protein